MHPVITTSRRILSEAASVSLTLFKIMVPILLAVRVIQELGWIEYVAAPLGPIMALVGLPPAMGLVWATAMVNNIYGGMLVFVSLAAQYPMTQAQVTVLATMILVAHSLPVELEVVRRAGARMVFQLGLRVGGAIALGWMLDRVYAAGGWLQQPNVLLWNPAPADPTWLGWGLAQVKNLGLIFLIILGLVILMRILSRLGITDLCIRLLAPVLRMLGIGREAGSLTIVGMIMGLSYGGGLIMHEVGTGRVRPRDVFFSLSLMGLAHSVIEDTFLLAMIGGHASGLLWGRVVFAMAVMAILVKLTAGVSEEWFRARLYWMTMPEPKREASDG